MGRTPLPLKILVHPELADWPEFQELREQGHTVVGQEGLHEPLDGSAGPFYNFEDFDLVLGPTCWRMDQIHKPYLDLALKAARAIKYPRGKKE